MRPWNPAAYPLLLVCCLAGATSVGAQQSASSLPPIRTSAWDLPLRQVHVGELHRSFRVYVPDRLAASPGLVIALHGSIGDASQARFAVGTELERLADAQNYVVAYPNGLGGWNGCRRGSLNPASVNGVDDVAFMEALVNDLVAAYGVDRRKLFALGYSGGGHLVYRLALERPHLMAAHAAMVMILPAEESMECEPSGEAVSILIMNGTADPSVRFEGGPIYDEEGEEIARMMSTNDTFEYWARVGGMRRAPRVEMLPDVVPEDDSTVEVRSLTSPQHEVMLVVVHGGGHTLPGMTPPPGPPRAQNQDVNAMDLTWRFFMRQLERQQAGAAAQAES